ncbi:hypothetical protein [Leptospira santarosai]|uniref:hypothetical protein n=1 Tax=Leptospira santarosai TaxID=28183 RepID=UPI000A7AC649|nr:hypothetical protein [Leptospira santarosai]MDI7229177.1 hypothetical protein [Leptospira santarosai]
MPINKQESLRRLSFIKYLFLIGSEQSNKPEPLCNISVLSFHDSIELFLQLASEHYNISASNFMEYFDKLESKISITQKETMKRFNKARVAIKHHGNMVPKSEIDSFKISCYNFFLENTLSIFNLNFESISLIDLVMYEKTKEHLATAEKEIVGSNYSKAMAEIAIAFWTMIEGYEDTKKNIMAILLSFLGGK